MYKRQQEELPFAISCVVQEIQKKNSHVMIFAAHRQKKEYYNLPVSDILYIESENHQTKIYTVSTKDAIITRDSLRSYMEKEEFQGFIPISVSCIVNIEHIFSIEKDTLVSVSYTHIDVYKRQEVRFISFCKQDS